MQNWMFQRLNWISMNLILGVDAGIEIGSRHGRWEIDSGIITFSLHVFGPSFIPGCPHCHEPQLLPKEINLNFLWNSTKFEIFTYRNVSAAAFLKIVIVVLTNNRSSFTAVIFKTFKRTAFKSWTGVFTNVHGNNCRIRHTKEIGKSNISLVPARWWISIC